MAVHIHSIFKNPPKTGIEFIEPTLTQQQFKSECDINCIMQRYAKTGLLVDPTIQSNRKPIFGDFSAEFDYQSTQNMIVSANQQFAELSATLRKRFHNNPAELLEFLGNEENRDEAVKLGLINAPVEPEQSADIAAIKEDREKKDSAE